ncbi:DUF91 domain-containing protein [Burkholderia plantarii]|uniref:DUF5655 domain-containing protein n=1 Tax=Burkholderia plantarii TaxID=41899 RepID=UPI00272AEA0C|nr:DUF5655 domain-containing protein [Burkholderia plantarii]WLE57563.1 DUF91 domain-containing protein [Burkholderia plantarii]
MSDIQLFRLSNGRATELSGQTAKLEKNLQNVVESNMPTLIGVRFLATEYATGKTHKGRIDSLGLDENGCPVIIEYKRQSNENVITQGLFYLDWLLDHRAEFRWLVMEKLGKETANQIEWAGTRLLCIAADFTRYDQHAVQQIQRNIELIRYKLFDEDLLLLELVNSQSIPDVTSAKPASQELARELPPEKSKAIGKDKSLKEQLALASPEILELHAQVTGYLFSLGEDVQENHLKLYTAFRKIKNFACVIVYPGRLLIMLKLDSSSVTFEEGFSRDVSEIGHWGTGNVELILRTLDDLERAKPLLALSYLNN